MFKATTQRLEKETVLVSKLNKAFVRSPLRGIAENTWDSSKEVCYDWGFDPQLSLTYNICVWHAVDDTFCPSETGASLAKYFTEKGVIVNLKNESEDYGHFTYSRG